MGLEDEARKRRERLKALRKAKEDGGPPPKSLHADTEKEDKLPNPELKLRNYNPTDETLNAVKLDNPLPVHVDDKIKEQLDAGQAKPAVEGDIDLANLQPKKIDWDLKRAVQDKLDKLERRTQKAIAELIRERLKETDGNTAEIIDVVRSM